MNKMLRGIKRNASTILTVTGAVGVVSTTVLGISATPRALQLIQEAKEGKDEQLTKFEVVLAAAPAYVPTVLSGLGTIACIVGANVLNKRNQAALVSAYALLDASYKDYRNKVIDIHGEEGDKTIRAEIAKDKAKEQGVPDEEDGKILFYDEYSKRFFRATNESVLRAKYEINKEVNTNFYATVNEFYDIVGLPQIDGGDIIGWSSTQLYEYYWSDWVDFWFEKMELESGEECFIIHFTDPFLDINEEF